ncbi:MAG: glycosyl transferase [Clostridia bacterium]|nr:glycosyl transferase [Clostridia bacterium]
MIPKTIHYCWFGRNEKPKLVRKCIASWKKHCPDYEIIEWNEDNFDVSQHPYLQWRHDRRKWAFLSDVARLLVVKEHGGIYLDTDVEVIRTLDDLRQFDAYFGFEEDHFIATGLGFGSVQNHPVMDEMLRMYFALEPNKNGEYPTVSCPTYNTNALLPHGLVLNGQRQKVLGAEILPTDYLNPYDDPTGRMRKTKNTFSIHWYGKSWMNKKTILRSKFTRPFHRLFGKDIFKRFRKNQK